MAYLFLIGTTLLLAFIGLQIELRELKLLSFRYHYRIGIAQWVTFLAALIAYSGLLVDINMIGIGMLAVHLFISLLYVFLAELVISRLSPRKAVVTWGMRIAYVLILASLLKVTGLLESLSSVILIGLFVRNSPFGVPHLKQACLAYCFHRKPLLRKVANETILMPSQYTYDVTQYGILPDEHDNKNALQSLIDKVGAEGGGRIFFPKGRYHFNRSGKDFLQINHSNITLDGAVDSEGKPLAELINCAPTTDGRKNPWLSPFFITTGESLQPSNEFFGLQFRKKKNVVSQSSSISDPGSDGSLLTPSFAANIISASSNGELRLLVDNTRNIGKYILVGLYNTTDDGNLIRDILQQETLRPEWTTAKRAGEERAPSYQWLVEVDEIIDDNTISLVRPLLRDIEMVYEPQIYNVEMLQNICIRNLCINSYWNGCFRHHGFPIYYNVGQSQEMDYGWNAINMKRVAHGVIENVVIKNFTNPIYVLDSRDIVVRNVEIKGYDGHQGIKLYQHACDNIFEHITFHCAFADMMGGEGNAYGNVFRNVEYVNPVFNPVDFDFHGFSEGPMSPPADNTFINIRGFRYIKSAAARHMLPGCSVGNRWENLITEGERRGDALFLDLTYKPKRGLIKIITAAGYSVVMMQKGRQVSLDRFKAIFMQKLKDIDATGIMPAEHYNLFKGSVIRNLQTWADVDAINPNVIDIK